MEWLGTTISAITRKGRDSTPRRDGGYTAAASGGQSGFGRGRCRAWSARRERHRLHAGADVVGSYSVQALGRRFLSIRRSRVRISTGTGTGHCTAVELASSHGLPITRRALLREFGDAVPGRLERIERRGVQWILDVAHNPAGAWALRAGLRSAVGLKEPRTLIFSCLRDKPWRRWRRFSFRCFRSDSCADSCARAAPWTICSCWEDDRNACCCGRVGRQGIGTCSGRCKRGAIVVSGSVYLVVRCAPCCSR